MLRVAYKLIERYVRSHTPHSAFVLQRSEDTIAALIQIFEYKMWMVWFARPNEAIVSEHWAKQTESLSSLLPPPMRTHLCRSVGKIFYHKWASRVSFVNDWRQETKQLLGHSQDHPSTQTATRRVHGRRCLRVMETYGKKNNRIMLWCAYSIVILCYFLSLRYACGYRTTPTYYRTENSENFNSRSKRERVWMNKFEMVKVQCGLRPILGTLSIPSACASLSQILINYNLLYWKVYSV